MNMKKASYLNGKAVTIWLGVCVALVVAMVWVGGLTRLTESGLSMVDWQPIHGIFPPLNLAEWQEEFAAYQQSPQYEKVNFGMSLDAFKGIFWLEYWHRVLGRVIGLVFGLPLLFFALTKQVTRKQGITYFSIFLLGGAQGLLGWYMVKSGLVNEPMVSPLRLAAHLSLACFLFGLLFWQWLKLLMPARLTGGFNGIVAGFIGLLYAQIALGGVVAGLDAGLAYDSFPTMNGQWIPNGLEISPWYANATAAQFVHRLGAMLLLVYFIIMLISFSKQSLSVIAKASIYALIILITLQITLGALTVIYHVPIGLASAHQMMALLLLSAAITLLFSHKDDKAAML